MIVVIKGDSRFFSLYLQVDCSSFYIGDPLEILCRCSGT